MLRKFALGKGREGETEPWSGPLCATATCSVVSLTEFYRQFEATTRENPEGVGYADFGVDGRPCGVEVYCAPASTFYSCLSIDHETVHIDRSVLAHRLEGLVMGDAIDDLGVGWQIRFYSPGPVPDALHRILRTMCGCAEGGSLEINQWWS